MSDGIANKRKAAHRVFRLGPYTMVLAVVWTAIVCISLVWNLHEQGRATTEVARAQARAGFEKDVLYRRWNAMHGGVYAPATEKTEPNSHLDVPERDIETPAGRKLTLVNPAYMTRQVYELGAQTNGVQGHITSLKPIRPENAADPWETAALEAFERGETECSSIEVFRGEPHLRLMRPFFTEKGCLKCHATQGYQAGDIRGGVSVSVPMAPLWATGRATMFLIAAWHGSFWILGLGGIGLSYRHLRVRIRERDLAEQANAASERQLHSILRTAPDTILTVDRDGRIQFVNRTVPGSNVERVAGTNIRDHFPAESYESVRQAIEQVFLTGEGESIEHVLRPQGATTTTWQVSRIGPVLENGEVTAVTIVSTDITERKERKDVLRKSMSELEAFNRLAVGRELRMVELKAQVNSLLHELGRAPEYDEGSEEETTLVSVGVSDQPEPCPAEGSHHER